MMVDEPQGEDRRRHPRYSVRLMAAISAAGAIQPAAVHDVSQGGAFVTTTAPQPIGTQLKIRMSMSGEQSEEESIDGRVVRVVEVQGDQMPDHITGMGIEFRLTPEQREKLRTVLLKYVGNGD
jgi:Tfp pilus assembly protein PilZ